MTNPRIVVTGRGEAEGTPDRCVLHAALNVIAPSAADAVAQLGVVASQVVEALRGEGLTPSEIRTRNLSLHDFFDQKAQKVTARIGSYQMDVTIDDLNRVGPLLAVLTTVAGDSFQVRALQLTMRDPEPLQREARTAAVVNARAKAEQMAAAAGVRLGPLVQIEEVQHIGARNVPFTARTRTSGGNIIPPMPVEPGSATVTGVVTVTYEVSEQRP